MEWSIGSGKSLVRVFPGNGRHWRNWDVYAPGGRMERAWTLTGAIRLARRKHHSIVGEHWSRLDPEWIRD